GRGGSVAPARPRAGPGCACAAARPAARGDRAGLLRRVYPVGARRAARPAAGHDQESHVLGLDAPARAPRRRDREDGMDLHDLTAGYALDALDPDERARYEEHLASCESCRAELQEFWQVAGALGRAAGGPTPPASLRDRILQQARDERPNVVPLRRRITVPVLASAAAVAALVAVALGVWSLGLSNDLDQANSVVDV